MNYIEDIKRAKTIALIGNGGNLAICRHAASDMSRHLGKFCYAPEGVHMSALGGDGRWHEAWIESYASHADYIIGLTTRIDSPIACALEGKRAMIIAPEQHPTVETIVLNKESYHAFEVAALWEFYMIMERCGAKLPNI